MDLPVNIKCSSCKKEVATDVSRCLGCRSLFHPGCFKVHRISGSDGDKFTCASKPEILKRAGNARTSAAATQPPSLVISAPISSRTTPATTTTAAATTTTTTIAASDVTAQLSSPPEITLASVLAAVQACATTITTFRNEQLLHNASTDGSIAELRLDLATHMERLSSDLRAVSQRVRSVEAQVTTLDADVKASVAKHDALAATVAKQFDDVEGRQRTYAEALRESQRVAGATAAKLQSLTTQVHRLQTERRSAEIVISSLPGREGEDLRGLLRKTAAVLGAPLTDGCISRTTRMRGSPEVERPRLIHVVLSSRAIRDALIAGKRSRGRLLASDIAADLGSRPVLINEYLPRDTWALLRKVRTEARARGFAHVWHRDGRIFVKKSSESSPIIVGEEAEIAAKLQ